MSVDDDEALRHLDTHTYELLPEAYSLINVTVIPLEVVLHVPDLALWARQKIQRNQQGRIPVDGCLLGAADDLRQVQIPFKYMVAIGVVSLALSAISAAFTYKSVENLDQNQNNVRHYLLPLQFALTILWLFLMWRTTKHCGNYYVTLLLFVVAVI